MSPVFKIIIASENTFERRGLENAVTGTPDIEIVEELPNDAHLLQNDEPPLAWIIIAGAPEKSPPFEIPGQAGLPVPVIACCPQFPPAFIGLLKRKGVKGFVMTASSAENLLEAIYTVGNGEEYYCPLTLQHLQAHHKRLLGSGEVVFTRKELQVLELICQEFSDKEIAARTGTSRRTVETHKRNIRAKTKSYNNVGCINYARSQGIIFLQIVGLSLSYFDDLLALFCN
jgi:DNA-binding NarL/FixJ family response regulator